MLSHCAKAVFTACSSVWFLALVRLRYELDELPSHRYTLA
jgi:hypothetical protein